LPRSGDKLAELGVTQAYFLEESAYGECGLVYSQGKGVDDRAKKDSERHELSVPHQLLLNDKCNAFMTRIRSYIIFCINKHLIVTCGN